MTDNGDGPKVVGEIHVKLIERAPGQTEFQFTCSGIAETNEVLARGLWDKGREVLAQFFLQKQMHEAMRAVKVAPEAALDALRKHSRG